MKGTFDAILGFNSQELHGDPKHDFKKKASENLVMLCLSFHEMAGFFEVPKENPLTLMTDDVNVDGPRCWSISITLSARSPYHWKPVPKSEFR